MLSTSSVAAAGSSGIISITSRASFFRLIVSASISTLRSAGRKSSSKTGLQFSVEFLRRATCPPSVISVAEAVGAPACKVSIGESEQLSRTLDLSGPNRDAELIVRPIVMSPTWRDYIGLSDPEAGGPATMDSKEKADQLREAEKEHHADLDRAVEQLAQLSALDGAVLFGPNLRFLAAGFVVSTGAGPLPRVVRALDVAANNRVPFEVNGGARQRAAIRFADAHPGAVAFAISADGPVTCFAKLDSQIVAWPIWLAET
jgi:hypothetical protein